MLQTQVNEYVLMYKAEKNEKLDLMNKYDTLQEKYHQQSDSFSKERVNLSRKFYLLLGGSVSILLLSIILIMRYFFIFTQ